MEGIETIALRVKPVNGGRKSKTKNHSQRGGKRIMHVTGRSGNISLYGERLHTIESVAETRKNSYNIYERADILYQHRHNVLTA